MNQPIDPGQAFPDLGQVLGLGDALGGELGRGAFERAAELDAVADVAHRELGGDESAGQPRRHQAFLFEPAEHQPHRRA